MQILRKMSVAQLSNLSPKQLAALVPTAESPRAFVCRVAGAVRSYEIGSSTYGEFLKFKGEFRGWDIAGEMSASSVAFFPAPVDGMLKEAVDGARESDADNKASVEFAFDIYVVHDGKEGSKGYQYRVETLTESKVSDPVATLTSALPGLPAPQAAPASEAAQDNATVPMPAPEAREGAEANTTGGKKGSK